MLQCYVLQRLENTVGRMEVSFCNCQSLFFRTLERGEQELLYVLTTGILSDNFLMSTSITISRIAYFYHFEKSYLA